MTLTRLPHRKGIFAALALALAVACTATAASMPARASEVHSGEKRDGGRLTSADLEAKGYVCEQSDDAGDAGTKGCFKDDGDIWYACDIDKGGSGTAYVRAARFANKDSPVFQFIGAESDDATDGTKVLEDCDKGPHGNVPDGWWMGLLVCIKKDGDVHWNSCDNLWEQE